MALIQFRKEMDEANIDKEMKERLEEVVALAPADGVVGYRLSPAVYAVRDKVSSLTPHGWVHVYKSELKCGLRYENGQGN